MKKLIAISVVFALLTGAAFAQVTLGAELWAEADLFYGNSLKASKDGGFWSAGQGQDGNDGSEFAKLTFSYETDGSEAGIAGKLEYDTRAGEGTDGKLRVDGAAWWLPVPQLKLWVGDKGFDRGDTIGWTDTAGKANDTYRADAIALMDALYNLGWTSWLGATYSGGYAGTFANGVYDDEQALATFIKDYGFLVGMKQGKNDKILAATGVSGLNADYSKLILYEAGSGNWFGLSIIPMEMFTLNISVIGQNANGKLDRDMADAYGKDFMIQGIVTIPGGFGELSFTYDNSIGAPLSYELDEKKGWKIKDTNNAFFLDYFATDLMGLPLDIGFGFSYWINASNEDYNPKIAGKKDEKKIDAWFTGLYAGYTVMDGLVARFLFDTWAFAIIGVGADVTYTMDLSPWTFTLFAKVFANIALEGVVKDKWEEGIDTTNVISWEVEPKLSQNIGGFTFSAALNLSGDTAKTKDFSDKNEFESTGVNVKVPVRFSYSF